MRSRLNLAIVGIAGACALVLTAVRQTPDGVLSLELDTRDARAAPGDAAAKERHDLSALKIFNLTLLRIKDRYVDSSKIDPKKMLFAALDQVQASIPEVLVASEPAKNKVTVAVNDKREVFDTDDVDSLWRMTAKLKRIFRFVETNMNAGSDLAKVEYAAINGMLGTLDPHSILMDPEQARDMDVSTSGKFGGLGIVIRMIDRKLTVVKPMKDTPAWRAHIKAEDHIVKRANLVDLMGQVVEILEHGPGHVVDSDFGGFGKVHRVASLSVGSVRRSRRPAARRGAQAHSASARLPLRRNGPYSTRLSDSG